MSESENQPQHVHWIPSPDGVSEVYANYATTTWSLFDVRIRLGQLIPHPTDGGLRAAEERAALTMSWPQAKAVLRSLKDLVESYEVANGEIKPIKMPALRTVAEPESEQLLPVM